MATRNSEKQVSILYVCINFFTLFNWSQIATGYNSFQLKQAVRHNTKHSFAAFRHLPLASGLGRQLPV